MKIIATVFMAAVFSGCVPIPYPHRVTDMPGIQGRVINAQTGAPVENIFIIASKHFDGGPLRTNDEFYAIQPLIAQQTATSDETGTFVFEEEKHWQFFKYLWLGPIDFPHFTTALSLSYKTGSDDQPKNFDNPDTKAFGHKLDYVPCVGYNSKPKYGPYRFEKLKINTPNQSTHSITASGGSE